MNKFNRISATVLAGMALYGASGASHGLGYGRPTSRAILGETLSVSVPLHLESGDDVANECVAADVYFGEDKLAAAEVQAALLPGAGRERVIRVTTRKFINEPVITVYVAAGCASKITRKFVAFSDPPSTVAPSAGLDVKEAAPVAYAAQPGKVSVGGVTIETGGSTIAAAPPDASEAAPRVARNSNSGSKKSRSGASPTTAASVGDKNAPPALASGTKALQGAPSMSVSPGAQAQAAPILDEATLGRHQKNGKALALAEPVRPGPSGERLMLDPVDADALVLPTLRMSGAMQGKVEGDEPSPAVKERRLAAAALWLALNATPEQMAKDRQRVQELEQRLASLQKASDQAQQQVAALQSRVREAESATSNTGLVYGLGGLAAVLAAALAALFIKDRRKAKGADWWKAEPGSGPDAGEGDGAGESALARTLAQFQPVEAPAAPGAAPTPPVLSEPVPNREAPTFSVAPPEKAPAAQPMAAAKPARAPLNEPPREVSVEELIDLEQQAEFFIVLGQDDAAIDLLESHVQSTTGASPLPFLKLLEIYQRLGKRQDYERVQSEFNQRFNGYAPAWESDLLQGHSLADYPGIVERLQTLWQTPGKAMDVLERSLTRPDAEVETFDLPAYRELLFLYAVARDLSEREAETRSAVDLTLPFIDSAPVPPMQNDPVEPLMATRPVKAQPQAQPVISLDLSLDDLEPMDLTGETAAPAAAPTTAASNEIEFEHVAIPTPSKSEDHHKP